MISFEFAWKCTLNLKMSNSVSPFSFKRAHWAALLVQREWVFTSIIINQIKYRPLHWTNTFYSIIWLCSFLFRIFIYILNIELRLFRSRWSKWFDNKRRARCLQGDAASSCCPMFFFSGYPRIARYAKEIVMCKQFATKKDNFGWYLHLSRCRQQRRKKAQVHCFAQTVKQQ